MFLIPYHEAIQMGTHSIQINDKIRKFPQIFVFLSYRKNFVGTQKIVWISHGKWAIHVRAIVVGLYFFYFSMKTYVVVTH